MGTYKDIFQKAVCILSEKGIADANVDAWYLLAHVFRIDRAYYLLHGNEITDTVMQAEFFRLINKRANHIPLQYITRTQEFMGLEFYVTEDVLIPRQDTESLVEEVLKVCSEKTVLDMCTGSGCIIISLAKLGGLKLAAGADISHKALEIARQNAHKHHVSINLIKSDLFENVVGDYDIIVSNPPYIPTTEIGSLMPEVKDHEPLCALDGSADGLMFYRKITAQLGNYLRKGGYIFYEIGHNQGEDVMNILKEAGFYEITIKKDLCGHDRVIYGRR